MCRRYVQVLSLIFSFTSTYNDHSAHYVSFSATFGVCVVATGRDKRRVCAPIALRDSPVGRFAYHFCPHSPGIVNCDVDFVSPSCIMPDGVWKYALPLCSTCK